jgi:hypothetical protein
MSVSQVKFDGNRFPAFGFFEGGALIPRPPHQSNYTKTN